MGTACYLCISLYVANVQQVGRLAVLCVALSHCRLKDGVAVTYDDNQCVFRAYCGLDQQRGRVLHVSILLGADTSALVHHKGRWQIAAAAFRVCLLRSMCFLHRPLNGSTEQYQRRDSRDHLLKNDGPQWRTEVLAKLSRIPSSVENTECPG
jgi:hypothetical protein